MVFLVKFYCVLVCGCLQGLSLVLAGFLCSILLIGIPIGRQCFKLASLAFFPIGKEVNYGGSAISVIANIFWMIFSGSPLAVVAVLNVVLLCCTIIGIPFGLQCFKIAKLALFPFGASVINT